MARRLRFNGTGSGEGSCPAVHEDLDTGEVIVHGPPLTDPEDIAQLQHRDPDEVAIVIPRNTLIDFAPRDRDTTPRILDPDQFDRLFENFQHSAWHLETRTRYAVDEATETYAQFARGEAPTWDMSTPWSTTIRAKTSDGAAVGRVRVVDNPPTGGQLYLLAHARKNAARARTYVTCGARTRSVCTCPPKTSGSSILISSPCASSTATTISLVPS